MLLRLLFQHASADHRCASANVTRQGFTLSGDPATGLWGIAFIKMSDADRASEYDQNMLAGYQRSILLRLITIKAIASSRQTTWQSSPPPPPQLPPRSARDSFSTSRIDARRMFTSRDDGDRDETHVRENSWEASNALNYKGEQ